MSLYVHTAGQKEKPVKAGALPAPQIRDDPVISLVQDHCYFW